MLVCFRPELTIESSLLQFSRVGTGALFARSVTTFVPNSLSRLLAATIAASLARLSCGEQTPRTLLCLFMSVCDSLFDSHWILCSSYRSIETGDEINNRVLCVVDATLSRPPIVHSPLVDECSIVPFRSNNTTTMVDLSFVHASFASACSVNLSLCRSSSVETGDEINNSVLCVVDAALSRSSIVHSPLVGGCSIDSSQFLAMNFAMDSRPSGRRAASV